MGPFTGIFDARQCVKIFITISSTSENFPFCARSFFDAEFPQAAALFSIFFLSYIIVFKVKTGISKCFVNSTFVSPVLLSNSFKISILSFNESALHFQDTLGFKKQTDQQHRKHVGVKTRTPVLMMYKS